jgi:hypothetical protein
MHLFACQGKRSAAQHVAPDCTSAAARLPLAGQTRHIGGADFFQKDFNGASWRKTRSGAHGGP